MSLDLKKKATRTKMLEFMNGLLNGMLIMYLGLGIVTYIRYLHK